MKSEPFLNNDSFENADKSSFTAVKSRCFFLGCLIYLLLFFAPAIFAQSGLIFSKYDISNSGCKASFPNKPGEVELSFDVDSNKVYTTRSNALLNNVDYHFCVIVMQLKDDDNRGDEAEKLVEYLDYYKSTQNIISAEGYTKVNSILKGKTAKGITDVWADQAGDTYAVAGWASGRTIAVMYVYGSKPFPAASRNTFFNGFHFPAFF